MASKKNSTKTTDAATQEQADAAPKTMNSTVLIGLVAVLVAALAVATFFIARSVSSGGSTAQPAAAADASQDASQYNPPNQPVEPATGEFAKALLEIPSRDPKDPRALGKADAPVVMTEFSDYSCPMCSKFAVETLPKLMPLVNNGTLRIEYRDMVIFDQQYASSIGAIGGLAAGEQGKFWEFYKESANMALSSHPVWTRELAVQVAEKVGVPNIEKFKKDMDNPKLAQKLSDERIMAEKIGVRGTPAFVINDRFIGGALPTDTFIATIKAAAQKPSK